MVNAELNHNPYLLQTSVLFNGQIPRINSQIEKYEQLPLKDWVQLVPSVFYHEMNGYDFDLLFVGTRPDYDEVCQAFRAAGVSEQEVRVIYKNEIEAADTKSAEVDELIAWLRANRNRKFDFDSFMDEHSELFEGTYPYIIIRGTLPKELDHSVSAEIVSGVQELSSTVLTNTPILFFIESDTSSQFRQDLSALLQRKDVRQEQLFFMVHPMMNTDQVARVISDLGVANPQIVTGANDEIVRKYLQNYPITEFVRDSIKVLRSVTQEIGDVLEAEQQESLITNAEIHERIDALERDLTGLKLADQFFGDHDTYIAPSELMDNAVSLEEQIFDWKNRKTKVVGDEEANIAAEEYEHELRRYLYSFASAVTDCVRQAKTNIEQDFADRYRAAGVDINFCPEPVQLRDNPSISMPNIKDELLKMKDITYTEAKTDIFSMFRRPAAEENTEPVRVVTCYFEQWRAKAKQMVMPLADDMISYCRQSLAEFHDSLARVYHEHICELIRKETADKDAVSAQLSDDERKLQEDIDWMTEVSDRLTHIERG